MIDLTALTFDGEPIAGRVPPRVVVRGPEMTPGQVSEVTFHYKSFCTARTLSVALNHFRIRVLDDGTVVMFQSIHGIDTITVTTTTAKPGEEVGDFVAYTAFAGLPYCTPVFSRAVFDGTTYENPIPPPPVYTAPTRPPDPPLPRGKGWGVTFALYEHSTSTEFDPVFYERYVVFIEYEEAYLSDGREDFVYTLLSPQIPEWGTQYAPGNFDVGAVWYPTTPTSESISGNIPGLLTAPGSPPTGVTQDTMFRATNLVKYTKSSFGASRVYDTAQWQPQIEAAVAAGPDAVNTARFGAWNDEVAAIDAAYADAVAAAIAAYDAALDAWEALYGSAPAYSSAPILAMRISERPVQLAALRTFLDAGIATPHLTARLLLFPFNIRTKPTLVMGDGPGAVTYSSEVTAAPHKHRPLVFAAAIHTTGHPTAGYEMGRDIALPTSLFGWQASGTEEEYQSYYAHHASEVREIRPGDLSALTFTQRTGYTTFANGGIQADPSTDLRINSDAYVPPGATVTVYHLEWEVWDQYTHDWIWTPVPEITDMDSIWVASLGTTYELPSLDAVPGGEHSPRKVRIRAAYKQTRSTDWSWTAPTSVTLPAGAAAEVSVPAAWVSAVDVFPAAIVLAQKLNAGAAPYAGGSSTFPFGSTWLSAAMPETITVELATPWDEATDLRKLIAQTLLLMKKVKT